MNKKTSIYVFILSFFIPFIFLLAIYIIVGIAPFGNNTMVIADAKAQYISFFSLYRSIIKGETDAFYSFSKVLGGSTAGLFAYYLSSPLNLLLLLFPEEKLPAALDFLILFKLSLCGLTMAVFFSRRHTVRLKNLIFTTAYSLCGYNIAFSWSLMWIDAVVLLPLVISGIEYIFYNEKPVLYIVSLGISIISCFYTGYMVCLFSVLYYAYIVFENRGYCKFRKHLIYIFASLLAGGISSILLIPGYKALSSGIKIDFVKVIESYTYPAMLRVLNLFPAINNHDSLILPCLILVFFSFVVFGGFSVYYILHGKKYKIIPILIFFVILSVWYIFIERYVNSWNGNPDKHIFIKFLVGYTPFWEMFDGSPNVYIGSVAFLLSLCYFINKKIPVRRRLFGFLLLSVLVVSISIGLFNILWHGFEKNDCFNYRYSFLISFLLLTFADECFCEIQDLPSICIPICGGLCLLILIYNHFFPIWFWNSKWLWLTFAFVLSGIVSACLYKRYSKIGVVFIFVTELSALLISFGLSIKNQTGDQAISAEYFSNIYSAKNELIDIIKHEDSDFYRIRKDGIYINFNDPMLFNYAGTSHYSSSEREDVLSFLNSLGQRSAPPSWANGDLGESRALDSLLGVRYYLGDTIDCYETISDGIHKNPASFPLAFLASSKSLNKPVLNTDVPENINRIYSNIYGENIDIFVPAESINGSMIVANENAIYVRTDVQEFEGYILLCNGVIIQQKNDLHDFNLICLGSFECGDQLEIVFFNQSGQPIDLPNKQCLFYYEDFSNILKVSEKLKNYPVNIQINSSSCIDLDFVSEDNQLLIMTLPKDSGWKIWCNNIPVEPVSAFNILLAVPVSQGNYIVSLRYSPPGFNMGICISIISLLVFIAWMSMRKRAYRKRV